VLGRPAPAPGDAPGIMRHYVGPDHFRTLGIPVLRGRPFESTDRDGRPAVAIVNESAARRFWPNANPIGQRIWFGGGSLWNSPDSTLEIVGVVGDVPYQEGDDRRARPAVYTSYLRFTYATRTVIVRASGDAAVAMRGVRDAVRGVDPDLALYDFGLLSEQLGEAWAKQRFTSAVLAAFAGLALLLAATGVFGVVATLVSERTREIGIRIALGATPSDVGRLVVRQGMKLPLAGLAVGAVLAFPAAQALRPWLPCSRSWRCSRRSSRPGVRRASIHASPCTPSSRASRRPGDGRLTSSRSLLTATKENRSCRCCPGRAVS
jgi:putative ABC transport system permease protein